MRNAIVIAAVLFSTAAHALVTDTPCELPKLTTRDVDTNTCLVCHDGSFGSLGILYVRYSNHPYKTSYAAAWSRGGYRPLFRSSPVHLYNGTVVCTTCHAPASLEYKHLAMPRTELCTACHVK